jgi:hypothetical protein
MGARSRMAKHPSASLSSIAAITSSGTCCRFNSMSALGEVVKFDSDI